MIERLWCFRRRIREGIRDERERRDMGREKDRKVVEY